MSANAPAATPSAAPPAAPAGPSVTTTATPSTARASDGKFTSATPAASPTAADESKATQAAPTKPEPRPVPKGDMGELLESVIARQAAAKTEKEATKPPLEVPVPPTAEAKQPASEPGKPAVETAPEKTGTTEKAEVAEDHPDIPQKLGEALKAIADPKARGEIRKSLLLAKDFSELMPISEAKERKMLAPTIEVERETHHAAQRAYQLRDALVSGTPEGITHFAESLRQEAPQAYGNLIARELQSLETNDPGSFVSLAERGVKNLTATLRQHAQAGQTVKGISAEDLGTVADILETFMGFGEKAPQSRAPEVPPQVEAELAALREQNAQRERFQRQQFFQSVDKQYTQALDTEIATYLQTADPDNAWSPQTKARLTSEIKNSIAGAVKANKALSTTTANILRTGDGQKLLDHLVNNAKGILYSVARDHVANARAEFGAAQSQREARQTAQASRRDLGASGVPAGAPAAPKIKFNGNAFEYLTNVFDRKHAQR